MSATPRTQGPPRWAILGAGGLALLLGGFVLLGPVGKQTAQAGEPSLKGAAVQTTEKLLLSLTVTSADDKKLSGNLVAELLDSAGKVIASREQAIEQGEKTAAYRFEFPALKQKPDGLTLRYTLGKHKVEVPLSKELLVKAHETTLSVGTEFHAGTTAALRCSVHGVKSLTETVPLPNSTVEVRLKDKDGKVHELFKGKADDRGAAAVDLKVPALPAGTYKMEVATRSSLGEEKLERDVKLKAEPKVLLVSDKPLYQPGQLIHLRALCLGAFDLKPVAEAKLVFEVEDSKGNKVFKREHTTSKHGVAAVDFQLASEVNQGEYKIRALLGDKTAEKSVTVKPYVLPKFKSSLSADKKFYAPRETIKGDIQIDYFFGKPVAGGKYKVTASTFDVAFKDFQTVEGKTDEQGHAKFEVKLPDYFVGQPLEKGNAIVKIEVKVTDKADHTETITRTYPVSSKPIQVSLIPEAGRLVPGVENRVFAAALYPDGSPAECDVQLWINKEIKNKFLGKKKTSASGLAEFVFTPDPKLYRPGQWQAFDVELLGGKQQIWAAKQIFDLKVVASDDKGTKVEAVQELTSEPFGSNVMLRLDKAVYNGGDTLKMDLRSTAGTPTVYVDLVRDGQTLLTRWLDCKDGKASTSVDLPSEVFGTVEVHAYQMLAHGEIVRDARVIYVQPARELKVDVQADRDVYKPGEEGKITFKVTDREGNPTAAALGVIIVDEAVYALQEMQPGLEKVYFTLQEELMKPQAQAVFKPSETIDGLVRQPLLNANQQQVAQALLCGVRPKVPVAWNVDPALGRKQKFDQTVAAIGQGLFNIAANNLPANSVLERKEGRARFRANALDQLRQQGWIPQDMKTDPFGEPLTLARLTELDPDFTPDNLARAVTSYRMQHLASWIVNFSNQDKAKLFKDDKWTFPEGWLSDLVKRHNWQLWETDGWGGPIKLVKRDKKKDDANAQFHWYELVSAGPDGKFDTEDDFRLGDKVAWKYAEAHWGRWRGLGVWEGREQFQNRALGFGMMGGMMGMGGGMMGMMGGFPPGLPGGIGGGGPPRAAIPEAKVADKPQQDSKGGEGKDPAKADTGAPPMRLREYFPETMLWRPALVTDEHGLATLPLTFADSITTWRLTASASSAGGLLGGVSAPLRVFQDFFVDLDLPVALTKNDEVAFPVAVYNYLKTDQTVKLELIQEPWFELMDGAATRSLELKSGEVTSVKFRIRARKVGNFPLQVNARGSKMSDAIKRLIEVVPDGQLKEVVRTDRLGGKVTQSILIPDNAIPDASKLIVKVYPGVFSQVLEGVDGLIRLPGG